jgi:hypothetical protein
MSARQKKKRAPKSAQSKWWEYPTFWTFQSAFYHPAKKLLRVDLILPDGRKIDLGKFPDTGNANELRHAVAERFRKIWDPVKRCRRPEKS